MENPITIETIRDAQRARDERVAAQDDVVKPAYEKLLRKMRAEIVKDIVNGKFDAEVVCHVRCGADELDREQQLLVRRRVVNTLIDELNALIPNSAKLKHGNPCIDMSQFNKV